MTPYSGNPPANFSQPNGIGGDHQQVKIIRLGRSSVVGLTLWENVPSLPGNLFIRPVGDNVQTIAGPVAPGVARNCFREGGLLLGFGYRIGREWYRRFEEW